jgi:hypothetical protein
MSEAVDKEPAVGGTPTQAPPKQASALSGIRRDLTDEELSSAGARKLLIDRLDQTERRVVELEDFREKYHVADKQVAVLTEKTKQSTAAEVLYGFALSAGAIFVGLAPSAWTAQPYGWLSLLVGVGLMIGALIFRGVRK